LHGIIRNAAPRISIAGQQLPRKLMPNFSDKDPKMKFAFKSFNPLTDFTLDAGMSNSAKLRIYNPKTVHMELQKTAEEFLHEYTIVNVDSKEIILPMLFRLTGTDFGPKAYDQIKAIGHYFSQYSQILELLMEKNQLEVKYQKISNSFEYDLFRLNTQRD